MRVIPAVDIYEGKCVRLHRGDFSTKKQYDSDPAEAAARFADAGARWIHVVDLEGAKNRRIVNWRALERILRLNNVCVQFGGGIRTREDVCSALDLGVKRVVVGSVAIQAPQICGEWIREFGTSRFCAAVDVREGHVAIDGWRTKEEIAVESAISELLRIGAKFFLCTDITRDGTLTGPNLSLYENLIQKYPSCCFLASGGVSSKHDLVQLNETGIFGAIVGKALYENLLNLEDLTEYLC